MTVSVRVAGPEDAEAISGLEREALGHDAWSDNLVAELAGGLIPTTLCLVAASVELMEIPVGYAAVSIVADVAELQRIAVRATHRRTGIASTLLAHVDREAERRHADRVLLEVRDDNTGALAFYARHGFTELSRRDRYYADGTTAIVLVRDIGRMEP